NPRGPHAGDLPNITIDEQGNATYEAVNDRISLGDEPGTSILAGDGSALIVHSLPEGRIYLAPPTTVYAADLFANGNIGQLEEFVTGLPSGGQHPNRTIAFGPDGRFYVTIGSTCNSCVESDERNATIHVAEPDGANLTLFAGGLRNTIGFGWHPVTGEMW